MSSNDNINIYNNIISDIKSNADKKRQNARTHYFKEKIRNTGLTTPQINKIFLSHFKEIKELDSKDTILLADKLYHSGIFEAEYLGTQLLYKTIKKHNLNDLYRLLTDSLNDGVMDNWAIIDITATHVMHYCINDNDALQKDLFKLSTNQNIWHRRMSIVAYVLHAKRGNYLDIAYKTAEQLIYDKEDLIHKAVGWVLRQSWYSDPNRLLMFIDKYGKIISRTTLRYAIEKMSSDERKSILQSTK